MSISVDQAGLTTFEDRVFGKDDDLGELGKMVRERAQIRNSNGDGPLTVYVKAKRDVKYGYVKRVIDELQKIDGITAGLQFLD